MDQKFALKQVFMPQRQMVVDLCQLQYSFFKGQVKIGLDKKQVILGNIILTIMFLNSKKGGEG